MSEQRRQIKSREARALLDGISRETLRRYLQDERLQFPKAIERRGRLYFWEDEILSWRESRPRVVALPRRAPKPADPTPLQKAA